MVAWRHEAFWVHFQASRPVAEAVVAASVEWWLLNGKLNINQFNVLFWLVNYNYANITYLSSCIPKYIYELNGWHVIQSEQRNALK